MHPLECERYYDHEPAYRDRLSRGWCGWSEQFDPCELEIFIAEKIIRPGETILDLGCGGGESSLMLADFGCQVIGLDAAPTALELAGLNHAHRSESSRCRVTFVRQDFLADPMPPARGVDVVLDLHCWHCLVTPEHRRALLRFAQAALRPGGLFVSANMCELPNVPHLLETVQPGTRISRDGRRYFATEDEVRELLVEAEYSPVFWLRRHDPNDIDYLLLAARCDQVCGFQFVAAAR